MKKPNSKKGSKEPVIKTEKTKRKAKIRNKNFPIVAIGGSAGSFKSIEKFFSNMPRDNGMAFVIIMHLHPNHKGYFSEIIQNYTPMPVHEVTDGMEIIPENVYVIPPNCDMGMLKKKLLILPRNGSNNLRLPIDYFFQSLAEDQWNLSAGIIFSGMGSDGEIGLKMIKEKLGLTIVQDPKTSDYESMPLAAISTNIVDYVLPAEEIPQKLLQYFNNPVINESNSLQEKADAENINSVQKILMMLRSQTGHDFSLYKNSTIIRRIQRRIALHQLSDLSQYIDVLRENPHEIGVLFNDLLIGVTKFFRDEAAFESLKNHLIPLLKLKTPNDPIRIWIAGCSTGEEAYSIAIMVAEFLENLKAKKPPKVQIFATDLDSEAIEIARAGVYNLNIIADVSPDRLNRFFNKKNDNYSIRKDLREMIVFAQHNLIKDAPFTRLDLLCCRNVMIYLNNQLQKRLIPIFHYSLLPKGILFLGTAETISGFSEIFSPMDGKWKIFERKEPSAIISKMIDFPFNVSNKLKLVQPSAVETGKHSSLLNNFHKILLEYYSPTSLLINEAGIILYVNGRTGNYLELNSGEAVMNINTMAKEKLKYPLINAIHQASLQKKQVTVKDIRLPVEDQIRIINISVNYFDDVPMQGLLMVIFEDKGIYKKSKKLSKGEASQEALDEIEKELIFTRQQLHSTIEQMETSLEELKSSNEELQSTNEELQSTNEESLTTKEEMESLNEELMTINMQYQSKAVELSQLNNDMKNLLDNSEIVTIFLDTNLNILRFTPQVKKLFNLIPSDIGRSITHIVSNFNYPQIEEDIHDVIEKLRGKEVEINTKDGEWYKLRMIPYRTLDNFISGAVLTFNSISVQKLLSDKIRVWENSGRFLLECYTEPSLLLDMDMNLIAANKSFKKMFHSVDEDIFKPGFLRKFNPALVAELEKLKVQAKKNSVVFDIHFPKDDLLMNCTVNIIADQNHKALKLFHVSLKE